MKLHLLSHAGTQEVGSVANNTIQELRKADRSADIYLQNVIGRLATETDVLTEAVGLVRISEYTEKLLEQDAKFDQAFIGTKQFVYANTFSLNNEIATKAEKIWAIFEAHDPNLYRLGYEQQIFVTHSLLNELNKPENTALIASLKGVSNFINQLGVQNQNLEDLFRESKADEAAKNLSVAPSSHKNLIRDMLNLELFPYLEVMSKANPELYAESFNVISEYVDSINIKVKARRTRYENQEKEIVSE